MTTFEKLVVRKRQVNDNFAFGNAKLTQTFLYINPALFTFETPIFEYKIGRGSERKRATEPRERNTKSVYSRG